MLCKRNRKTFSYHCKFYFIVFTIIFFSFVLTMFCTQYLFVIDLNIKLNCALYNSSNLENMKESVFGFYDIYSYILKYPFSDNI